MSELPQPPKDETILDEAKNLLVQGKRNMALGDHQSATDCLEQSCQLFDAYYGIGKRECADAYLEYGTALVALANLEAGSGTDKLMKKAGIEEEEEEEDEEEGEDEEAEEEEGDGEGQKENGKTNEEQKPQENGDSKMEHDGAQNGTTKDEPKSPHFCPPTSEPPISLPVLDFGTSEPVAGTSNGVEKKDGGDEDGEEVDNEEASTIEVAWEVLCLARGVFMKDESLEGRMKLAETLQKLGEISIEWDNNDNAASILEECLNIRKAILPPEDRLIALTFYNLGLAHSFRSDTGKANENFQNAITVIEKRISSLTDLLAKAKDNQDTVAVGAYEQEINELKELLPDMTMRLDDSKEDDETKSTEVIKRTREEMQLEDEEAKKVCSDKSKPVDDISHLVKRKAT